MGSSEGRRKRKSFEKLKNKLSSETIIMDFDFGFGSLAYNGPIITTDLAVTESHAAALNAAGLPVPSRVPCRFLIDTGADGTVVKHQFAEKAGLKLINANSPLHGVGVDTTGRTYIGAIWFGVKSRVADRFTHQICVNTQIMAADLQSDKIDGLIGRDVLTHFEMTYHGKSGKLKLKYLR